MTVTVRDGVGVVVARGRGTAPVTINEPNGPNCPPALPQVLVTLHGTTLVPTAPGGNGESKGAWPLYVCRNDSLTSCEDLPLNQN